MKKLLSGIILLFFVTTAHAKHLHSERWYQDRWATKYGGIVEYRLDNGCRVDILTKTHAIEVDFAKGKWAESVGQALYYATKTGKQPGIILICEKESDQKYVERVKTLILYWNLNQIQGI